MCIKTTACLGILNLTQFFRCYTMSRNSWSWTNLPFVGGVTEHKVRTCGCVVLERWSHCSKNYLMRARERETLGHRHNIYYNSKCSTSSKRHQYLFVIICHVLCDWEHSDLKKRCRWTVVAPGCCKAKIFVALGRKKAPTKKEISPQKFLEMKPINGWFMALFSAENYDWSTFGFSSSTLLLLHTYGWVTQH